MGDVMGKYGQVYFADGLPDVRSGVFRRLVQQVGQPVLQVRSHRLWPSLDQGKIRLTADCAQSSLSSQRERSMALTNCPECGRRVSDQALTCPNCGFPLAQSSQPDLGKILCTGRWVAQSGTLVDAMLEAEFSPNYTFQGLTRPDPNRVAGLQLVAYANFQGRWQVAGPQLFLDFPLTMASGPAQTQVAIQFTRISADALSGVDKWLRGWEWERVGT
jgi:hypothetical protein